MFRFLVALLLCASICLAQQDTGMITGLVTDNSGSAVPDAAVTVTNRDTNIAIKVVTGSDGIFVATPLRIGTYSIPVEAKGFKKSVQEGIQLRAQDRLRVDFRLEVGEITQAISIFRQPSASSGNSPSSGGSPAC